MRLLDNWQDGLDSYHTGRLRDANPHPDDTDSADVAAVIGLVQAGEIR